MRMLKEKIIVKGENDGQRALTKIERHKQREERRV